MKASLKYQNFNQFKLFHAYILEVNTFEKD